MVTSVQLSVLLLKEDITKIKEENRYIKLLLFIYGNFFVSNNMIFVDIQNNCIFVTCRSISIYPLQIQTNYICRKLNMTFNYFFLFRLYLYLYLAQHLSSYISSMHHNQKLKSVNRGVTMLPNKLILRSTYFLWSTFLYE